MSRVARSVSLTLTLVLVLLPVALERCRTSCASASTSTSTPRPASAAPAHACHDTIDNESGAVAAPLPKTCGHSTEARLDSLAGLAAAKVRLAGNTSPAIAPAGLGPLVIDAPGLSPPTRLSLPSGLSTPRDLPLRV